jgi:hypothetical protein
MYSELHFPLSRLWTVAALTDQKLVFEALHHESQATRVTNFSIIQSSFLCLCVTFPVTALTVLPSY